MRTGMAAVGLVIAAGVVAGCGQSSGSRAPLANGPALSAEDFAGDGAPAGSARSERPRRPMQRIGPITASQGVMDVTATAGPPTMVDGPTRPTESATLQDVMVGQIAGRPIFARQFLEPMSDQMVAKSRELQRPAWRTWARGEIIKELQTQQRDILLEDEALASFTPEQKAGLRSYIEQLRQDLRSQNLGSEGLANRRLTEEKGLTEDQYLKNEERMTLIREQLRTEVARKVVVSWKDIQDYYNQNFDAFNPPPRAFLRLIRVMKNKPEDVEAVRTALAEGKVFAEIAALPVNSYNQRGGGQIIRTLSDAEGNRVPMAEAALFGIQEVNAAAQTLAPGQQSGPIETESAVFWVSLDRIEEASVSLRDAQRQIEEQIRGRRIDERVNQYLMKLGEARGRDNLDAMSDALVAFAEELFLPTATAQRPGVRTVQEPGE